MKCMLFISVVIDLIKNNNQSKNECCIFIVVYRNAVSIGKGKPFFEMIATGEPFLKILKS